MKKVLKVLLIVLLIIAVIVAGLALYITSGLKSGANAVLSGIDPLSLSEGTYTGKYNFGRWTNELAVTVKDGHITDIKVLDDVTFATESTTKEIFDRVIHAQNTTVDAVTGATVTSKAYLKAIENALNKG